MVTTTILEINNLRKSYGQNEILKGLICNSLQGKLLVCWDEMVLGKQP